MKAWKESISCVVALSSILLLVLLATSSTFLAASSTDESSKSFYSQLSFLRTSVATLNEHVAYKRRGPWAEVIIVTSKIDKDGKFFLLSNRPF